MRVSGSHVGPLAAMPGGIRAGNLVETGMVGGAVLGERDRRTPAEIERELGPSGPALRRRFASSYGSRRAPGTEGRWSEGVLRHHRSGSTAVSPRAARTAVDGDRECAPVLVRYGVFRTVTG